MAQKIVFLNPPTKNAETVVRDNLFGCFNKPKAEYCWPPVHLAQLAAMVLPLGYRATIIDGVGMQWTQTQTLGAVKGAKPDFVVVVTATATYKNDTDFMAEIKEAVPGAQSVFCGNHITIFAEGNQGSVDNGALDYIINGEPEFVLQQLFAQMHNGRDFAAIKGLGYRKDGGPLAVNGHAPVIERLDDLPLAARHLIPKEGKYFNPLAKQVPYSTIFSSRGCPWPCIYCAAGQTYGKRFRSQSAERVIKEVEQCLRAGAKEIFFRDEEFTVNNRRVFEICELIKKKRLKFTWICTSRVDTVTHELLKAMRDAGCHLIKYGVESGSDEQLKRMKKVLTTARTRETFKWMHELGLDSVAHMIIGTPGETRQTIETSIQFIKDIDPTYVSFNIAIPYPHTEMWEMVKDRMGDTNDYASHDIESGLVTAKYTDILCGIPQAEMEAYFRKAFREFYYRPSYILRRLWKQRSLGEFARTAKAGISLMKFTMKDRSESTAST